MPDEMDLKQHWEEFYPVDWLINGGPGFNQCPDAEMAIEQGTPLTVMLIDSGSWIITAQSFEGEKTVDRVLYRSEDFQDIISYLKHYRNGLERFILEGE